MVVCPHCGRQSADTAKFCDKCGEPLPEGSAHVYDDAYERPVKTSAAKVAQAKKDAAKVAQVKREQAKKTQEPDAARQAEAALPRPEDMQMMLRPKSYKTPLIVVSIVAAVLIVILAGALAVQSYRLHQAQTSIESYQKLLENEANKGGTQNGTIGKKDADTIKSHANSEYADLVEDLIEQINEEAGDAAKSVLRESNGNIVDVDGDGTEELMMTYSPDGKNIYASVCCLNSSGKVLSATENLGRVSDLQFAGVYSGVLDGQAVICVVSTTESADKTYHCEGVFYAIKSGSVKKIHEFECTEPAGKVIGSTYSIDGDRVSEEEFNTYLSALTVGQCYYGTDTPGFALEALLKTLS